MSGSDVCERDGPFHSALADYDWTKDHRPPETFHGDHDVTLGRFVLVAGRS
jgi:hypothetical protein